MFSDPSGLIVSFNSFDADGNGRPTSAQELATWNTVVQQLSMSATGAALVNTINSPDFKLIVNSQAGAEPGGGYGGPGLGLITMDLNDPTGISPSTRSAMYSQGLEAGKVFNISQFLDQVSYNPGVIAGHELGHAVSNRRDEPYGQNVQLIENPIRAGIGEPPRPFYGNYFVHGVNSFSIGSGSSATGGGRK